MYRRRQPTGGTNLFGGLQAALAYTDVKTIFVLSDGAPTAGDETGSGAILGAVRRLNEEREATIHCVSLGRRSRLLRLLAKQSGGTYVER